MGQRAKVWNTIALIAMSVLILLLLMGIFTPQAAARKKTDGNSYGIVTVSAQGTPTVDPTITLLQKEQLSQQVDQLKKENSPSLWSVLGSYGTVFLAIVGSATVGISFWQWLRNRKDEERKRSEGRFHAVAERLGSENIGARLEAAVSLRTYISEEYEQFHRQVFDLAAANLQLRKADPVTNPNGEEPLPRDALTDALIVLFKTSYQNVKPKKRLEEPYIDYDRVGAISLQLDNAYLVNAQLERIWMREASLREAHLYRTNFSNARFTRAVFTGADLEEATLIEADLTKAILKNADLHNANLTEAILDDADFTGANLAGANPEAAKSLQRTKLPGDVLKPKQKEDCEKKGAIIL